MMSDYSGSDREEDDSYYEDDSDYQETSESDGGHDLHHEDVHSEPTQLQDLLKKTIASLQVLQNACESLYFLEMKLPTKSADADGAFVTALENNLSVFVQTTLNKTNVIHETIEELAEVIAELQEMRDNLEIQSCYYDGVNSGDWEDDDERSQERMQSNEDSAAAEDLRGMISDLVARIKGEVSYFDPERLRRAAAHVKWLKVFVYIVSAEFKPRAGNAPHPHFRDYRSPDDARLTPGLLLELFVTMIFRHWKGKATRVGGGGDGGVDILVKGNIPCQVKNYASRMGPAIVRELLGTMLLRDVKTAYIVYSQGEKLTAGVQQVVDQAKERGYTVDIITTPKMMKLIKKLSASFSSDMLVKDVADFDADFNQLTDGDIDEIEEAFDDLMGVVNAWV